MRKPIFIVACCAAAMAMAARLDIRQFGASADGVATAAIQAALDKAGESGGGTVVVPSGTWTTGTLWMRSHVELHLARGAVLKGSTREADYNRNDAFPENFFSANEEWSGGHLIVGYKVENVAITGEGKIDGNGPAFFGECDEDSRFPYYKYGLKLHPIDRTWFRPGPMVAFFLSKNIRLSGVTFANTPAWTAHFRCCDGLAATNVTIDADRTIANSDGFSIDCTRNVAIDGCTIKTGDDAFAIRASCPRHANEHPCENVRISNCDIWSCCWGVRLGIGTGMVRNVTMENCRIHESSNGIGCSPAWTKGGRGVYIENIRVSNCDIRETCRPIYLQKSLGADWRVRDLAFENCTIESLRPVIIEANATGRPENITFRNCSRRHLEKLRVRHHRKYDVPRNRRFIEVQGEVVNLAIEGCLPSEEKTGLLVLSFDDRNFDDWLNALPIFKKYDAHVTFFVCGPIDDKASRTMKKLSEAGHSVGLHGLRHANADVAVAQKGADRYFKEDIEPQMEICRVAYIPVKSFAYPNCRWSDESDALFKAKGFAHVRGGHKGVAPYDPKGEKQAGLKPIHTVDRAFFPADESPLRFRLDTVIAGESYHTDIEDILACIRRAAERKEVFVLTSHGIHPGAKGISMKTEWLERILATAKECGVRAVGFDDLP